MPQDDLVADGIKADNRWRLRDEIEVRNLENWSKGVSTNVRTKNDRIDACAHGKGVNRDVRAAVKSGLYLVNDLLGGNRRRPDRGLMV